MGKIALGCDFGASWIKAGLVNKKGKVLYQVKEETMAFLDEKAIINRLELIFSRLLQKIKGGQVLGVGLGVPGPVDFKTGIIENPPNLPFRRKVNLKKILQKKFNLPTFLDNDANVTLLGERFCGVAKGRKNVILFTVGTGIGGAVLIDGKIYHGQGKAGEFGHIIIDADSQEKCGCGNYGCLEALASASSITRRAKRHIKKKRKSLISKLARGDLNKIDGLIIYKAACQGDRLAAEILTQAGKYLGDGVASLINIFEPEMVIIGGQLSKAKRYFWSSMQKEVKKRCFLIKGIPVVKARLEEKAGILGGAFLVFNS
jgi:glucokinase